MQDSSLREDYIPGVAALQKPVPDGKILVRRGVTCQVTDTLNPFGFNMSGY